MAGTIEQAKEAIMNSSPETAIYLGTDSIRHRKNGRFFATYSTVVIVHVDGKHGCKLYEVRHVMEDYGNIKQRMLNEVMYTVDVGTQIVDFIGDRKFEIHIDVNKDPKHKSNVALQEARGYILGTFGIDPIFKPDALAATHGADHLVRA